MKKTTSYKSMLEMSIRNMASYDGELTKVLFVATEIYKNQWMVAVINVEQYDFTEMEEHDLELKTQKMINDHLQGTEHKVSFLSFAS